MLYSIISRVEKALLDSEPNRLVSQVLTQSEVLRRSYANDYATVAVLIVAVLIVVMSLMLLITGLGIVGLASFSVRVRTRQIGTRRALGARRRQAARYIALLRYREPAAHHPRSYTRRCTHFCAELSTLDTFRQ
jgi:putative ABC transport system permease protein